MPTAIIQARISSTRLPGKVLLELLGKPVLWHVINRVSKAKSVDDVIVATSTLPADDAIEEFCRQNNVKFFRGHPVDVLDRFYQCAKNNRIEDIVRITADCPLHDPHIIDKVVTEYAAGGYDYAANALDPTFPDGLDVEVFSFQALEKAWKNARLASEREHVTPYIIKHPDLFRIKSIRQSRDYSHMRWTLDNPEDYEFIREVYIFFGKDIFYTDVVLELLEKKPELTRINKGIKRNEGYDKSLEKDKETEGSDEHEH